MKLRKRLGLGSAMLIVVAALVYGFLPQPVPVQTDRATRGALQVTIEEEGETRLADRYRVYAPAAGHLRRMSWKVGDTVERGQELAFFESPRSMILDPRARAELAARGEAAQALLERSETAASLAQSERERIRALFAEGAVSGQDLERAEAEAAQALAARRAAAAERDALRALIEEPGDPESETPVRDIVRAPVSGRVLAIHREDAGPVAAGTPLLDLGDLEGLNVVVAVLSRDAVRIRPGTRVLLEQWGEAFALEAEVTRVAPAGHAAVSALGVEERRVPVEARILTPREQWMALGAGYRVLARFVLWEEDDVLQAPTAAFFRTDDGWAVWAVHEDRAVRIPVRIGRQAGLQTQILEGLAEDETVIIHPSKEISEGIRVRPRPE